MSIASRGLSIFVLSLLLLAGCNGETAKKSSLPTVSGNVTVDGKISGKGTVVFISESDKQEVAKGKITSKGKYSMMTGEEQGVPPGRYSVVVELQSGEKYTTSMEVTTSPAPYHLDLKK